MHLFGTSAVKTQSCSHMSGRVPLNVLMQGETMQYRYSCTTRYNVQDPAKARRLLTQSVHFRHTMYN